MTLFLFLIGLLGSTTIAIIGYHLKAISFDGIFTTIIIGTLITLSGNLATWASTVFLFGSSLIIKLVKLLFFSNSFKIEEKLHEKQGPRDSFQIISNTLPATLCLILYACTKNIGYLAAYLASIAGATADTWGSEIGILSKGITIDLTTLKATPKGLSGGVSFLGLSASFLGSFSSALVFLFFNLFQPIPINKHEILLIVGIGFLASLIDSLLGSLFQGVFETPHQELTEKKENNHLVRGFRWLTNDGVNLITNSISAVIILLIKI